MRCFRGEWDTCNKNADISESYSFILWVLLCEFLDVSHDFLLIYVGCPGQVVKSDESLGVNVLLGWDQGLHSFFKLLLVDPFISTVQEEQFFIDVRKLEIVVVKFKEILTDSIFSGQLRKLYWFHLHHFVNVNIFEFLYQFRILRITHQYYLTWFEICDFLQFFLVSIPIFLYLLDNLQNLLFSLVDIPHEWRLS